MNIVRTVLALLLAAIAFAAVAAGGPVVRTRLAPASVVIGQPVTLAIDILVPTWFGGAIDYPPTIALPGAVAKLSDERPVNLNERIGDASYAGMTKNYVIVPQQAGAFDVPGDHDSRSLRGRRQDRRGGGAHRTAALRGAAARRRRESRLLHRHPLVSADAAGGAFEACVAQGRRRAGAADHAARDRFRADAAAGTDVRRDRRARALSGRTGPRRAGRRARRGRASRRAPMRSRTCSRSRDITACPGCASAGSTREHRRCAGPRRRSLRSTWRRIRRRWPRIRRKPRRCRCRESRPSLLRQRWREAVVLATSVVLIGVLAWRLVPLARRRIREARVRRAGSEAAAFRRLRRALRAGEPHGDTRSSCRLDGRNVAGRPARVTRRLRRGVRRRQRWSRRLRHLTERLYAQRTADAPSWSPPALERGLIAARTHCLRSRRRRARHPADLQSLNPLATE